MSDLDESTQQYMQDQRIKQLEDKVIQAFGNLAIDKRRLPASQLQRRGVPAYVGEWILDSIVPGGVPYAEETDRSASLGIEVYSGSRRCKYGSQPLGRWRGS